MPDVDGQAILEKDRSLATEDPSLLTVRETLLEQLGALPSEYSYAKIDSIFSTELGWNLQKSQ
jgi:hypothetical protein